jgi:hypothetical protein
MKIKSAVAKKKKKAVTGGQTTNVAPRAHSASKQTGETRSGSLANETALGGGAPA